MKPALLFACIAASVSAAAYDMAHPGEKTAQVAIVLEADYAEVSAEIISRQRDPADRFEEIKETQQLIADRARRDSDIEVYQGAILLRAGPKTSGMVFYSDYREEFSAAEVQILVKLGPGDDIYDGAARIEEFIDDVDLPSQSKLVLGRVRLTVQNPEQYRGTLLRAIGREVETVKSTTGFSGPVTLTGLQGPILVRQVDNRNVELFINYELKFELSPAR